MPTGQLVPSAQQGRPARARQARLGHKVRKARPDLPERLEPPGPRGLTGRPALVPRDLSEQPARVLPDRLVQWVRPDLLVRLDRTGLRARKARQVQRAQPGQVAVRLGHRVTPARLVPQVPRDLKERPVQRAQVPRARWARLDPRAQQGPKGRPARQVWELPALPVRQGPWAQRGPTERQAQLDLLVTLATRARSARQARPVRGGQQGYSVRPVRTVRQVRAVVRLAPPVRQDQVLYQLYPWSMAAITFRSQPARRRG